MPARSIRVLVVDDFEAFRRFVAKVLQRQPELQIICEASDGLEAVQKAEEMQPDLVLLDIGLPGLNGIEAAQRIRELSPKSKILFVSQETSTDVVQEALASGGSGYVLKMNARNELLTAVNAVLGGKRFFGAILAGDKFTDPKDEQTADHNSGGVVLPFLPQNARMTRRHEAGFYSDDRFALDDLTQFIGAALKAGNAAIVVATEAHRDSLLPRLQAYGLDIGAAIEQGRYVALDAADALPTFILRGMPDSVLFLKLLGDLIEAAAKAAQGEQGRVAIFGEMGHLLWAQGKAEAAIQVEKLGNQLAKTYDVDILCGYSPSSVQGGMDCPIFQRICAEHSAVYSR
jgi:DNA-binding NarL/FixJ family response regulator